MDGTSADIKTERLEVLKKHFPDLFTEGKVDLEKFKNAFGDDIEIKDERYVLNWAGKSDCLRVLQTPTTATLTPCKEESVNFDTTENVFIEGENLEVLKILQKSYHSKIKMIYIDPPYNTGNDSFIYPDKFGETKEDYLKRIGQKDEEGYLTREGLFHKNSKDSGHYHSNWLSMMYPRLFLARNLLRDDGVIFISIDDNEVQNLKLMMNEIFGEENFRGTIIRSTGTRMGSGNKEISSEVDYVLVFSKSNIFKFKPLPMDSNDLKIYDQEDEKGKYLCRSLRRTGGENRRADRPSMFYPLKTPDGTDIYPIAPEGWESRWICSNETYNKLKDDGFIEWKKIVKNGKEQWQVYQKHYIGEAEKYTSNKWDNIDGNKKATREVNQLFDGIKYFDNPKPIDFLKKLISIVLNDNNEIVLDFFSGSGSLGHAAYSLNKTTKYNLNFICIQLPENCNKESEAYKDGYKTIADIGKERIRRVIKKIEEERDQKPDIFENKNVDLGFKVFKLQDSNFKIWRGNMLQRGDDVKQQLDAFVDPVREGAAEENMFYELLLKAGFDLNSKIEARKSDGHRYYMVNDAELVVALAGVSETMLREIINMCPMKVLALDRLFKGNDQLKTNTVLQMKDAGVEFRTV